MAQLVIAVDFDGTCVTHEYPYMGSDIGAVPVLKELVNSGCRLVLNTMRSGKLEREAVKWFKENDIPLFGVNRNPEQSAWSQSPKVYANLYIDDAALGVPLATSPRSTRPFVDWQAVRVMLVELGYIVEDAEIK